MTRAQEIFCNIRRLYNLEELAAIFEKRGMLIRMALGENDLAIPASDDTFQLLVSSQKL